ncbi:hypothetical protein [Tabrizicola sp.]|uniref:hypothetical protein n=1 Tax=Tabrizicola sp. TaxID=2005166 RepID=UPI0035B0570B
MKITDFMNTIGIDRFDAENWRRRVGLKTDYAPTVAGRAQGYSRENVLELALVGAFVDSGAHPPTAVAYADMVRRNEALRLRRWLVFPAGNCSTAAGTNDLEAGAIERCAKESPTGTVVVIDLHAIIAKVDGLFAQAIEGQAG